MTNVFRMDELQYTLYIQASLEVSLHASKDSKVKVCKQAVINGHTR